MIAVTALVLIVCPVTLIAMVLTAAGKKNREDIKNTEYSIRNIYLYTILIISLFAIIICSISAIRIGLDIVLPEKSVNNYYSSNQVSRNDRIIDFATSISIIIIAIPIFIKHSKLANNLKSK